MARAKQQCSECGALLVGYPVDADLICYDCFAASYNSEQPQTQQQILKDHEDWQAQLEGME